MLDAHIMLALIKACTRPLRAMTECFVPSIFFGGFCFLGLVLYVGILQPLGSIHATWIGSSCEFSGEMKLDMVVKRKAANGWRVIAPVTVSGKGQTWPGVAHRWPSRTMTDASKAALFNWWLGIGGTGKVLEPPSEGWFGSSGEFEFTTPIGKRVQCWYLPGDDGVTPASVKLSNEAVPLWGFWIGGALIVCLLGVLLAGACYFSAAEYESFTDKWERLEDSDEEELDRAKQNDQVQRRMLLRVDSRAGRLVGARAIHRSNSHFFSEPSQWYTGTHDAALRNGFLRKVYGILTCQVLLTATVAVLFMYSEPIADLVLGSCTIGGPTGASVYCYRWFTYGLNGVLLLLLLGCHLFKNEYPLNYLFLSAFTVSAAVVVGVICCIYRSLGYEELIVQALLYTGLTFACLTACTMQSRISFDFLAAPLAISLVLLVVAGIVARIFHSPWLYTAYAYCGSLVFMGCARRRRQALLSSAAYPYPYLHAPSIAYDCSDLRSPLEPLDLIFARTWSPALPSALTQVHGLRHVHDHAAPRVRRLHRGGHRALPRCHQPVPVRPPVPQIVE